MACADEGKESFLGFSAASYVSYLYNTDIYSIQHTSVDISHQIQNHIYKCKVHTSLFTMLLLILLLHIPNIPIWWNHVPLHSFTTHEKSSCMRRSRLAGGFHLHFAASQSSSTMYEVRAVPPTILSNTKSTKSIQIV